MHSDLLIKALLIVVIAVLAVFLTQAPVGSKHQAARRVLLSCFLAASVVSVMWPSLLTNVAHFVGVGRGTDLLLYGLVVAFVGYVVVNGRRIDHLMSKITLLTRELALTQAKLDEASKPVAKGEADAAISREELQPEHVE